MGSRSDQLFHKRKAERKRKKFTKKSVPSRTRVLIVCEGEKTESGYFKFLRKKLNLTAADIVASGESDSAPGSVWSLAGTNSKWTLITNTCSSFLTKIPTKIMMVLCNRFETWGDNRNTKKLRFQQLRPILVSNSGICCILSNSSNHAQQVAGSLRVKIWCQFSKTTWDWELQKERAETFWLAGKKVAHSKETRLDIVGTMPKCRRSRISRKFIYIRARIGRDLGKISGKSA